MINRFFISTACAGACVIFIAQVTAQIADPAVHADRAEIAEAAKYLGVVTCAGSTCHGAAQPVPESRVLQTEFLTWHREDRHANAYRALLSEAGQAIARNLGLENAATAAECLNCHANNVAEDLRGKRFQLADGVSCETCHGPASKWLGLHVTGEASRDDNIKAGMLRTDDPEVRAVLCLSCHLGAPNKFAGHRIMGAGHPRLSFELDTFSILQPAHFRLDADYRERKQVTSHAKLWAIGQASAASATLALFLSSATPSGALPEFAFFDCHACHHPLTKTRWAPRATTGLPPGLVRFNDAHFLMLLYLAKALDPALEQKLAQELLALHRATTVSADATRAAATSLSATVDQARSVITSQAFEADLARRILDSIIAGGIAGEYRDFAAAEQAVMAIHALSASLDNAGPLIAPHIQSLYAVLEDENTFDAEKLSAALSALKPALE